MRRGGEERRGEERREERRGSVPRQRARVCKMRIENQSPLNNALMKSFALAHSSIENVRR